MLDVLLALSLAEGPALALGDPEILRLAADKDPDVRCRALERARAEGAPPAPALAALLGDPHPKVRRRARDYFRSARDVDVLRAALKNPHPEVRGAAAELLGQLDERSAAEQLEALLKRESEGLPRAYALDALDRLAPERSSPWLEAAHKDPRFEARVVAAERRPSRDLVADRDWRVRAAAVEGCRRIRSREAVGWLIDQLPREKGRLRWDVVQALADLTGRDLGLAADSWAAWWSANRESFTPPAKGVAASGGTQASFFSIPILSTRVVFLLDLSGSMRELSPLGGSKLDEARRGTLQAIRALPPDVRFGICGLGCDAEGAFKDVEKKTWGGRLRLFPAVPAAKADAERFLGGLEARGWTNLFDGLLLALSDPEADTVYLYSDGGASKGLFVAAAEILDELARANRFRRAVVHTVEVPGERNPADNRRLLAEIAKRTGGTSRLYERK